MIVALRIGTYGGYSGGNTTLCWSHASRPLIASGANRFFHWAASWAGYEHYLHRLLWPRYSRACRAALACLAAVNHWSTAGSGWAIPVAQRCRRLTNWLTAASAQQAQPTHPGAFALNSLRLPTPHVWLSCMPSSSLAAVLGGARRPPQHTPTRTRPAPRRPPCSYKVVGRPYCATGSHSGGSTSALTTTLIGSAAVSSATGPCPPSATAAAAAAEGGGWFMARRSSFMTSRPGARMLVYRSK